MKKILVSSDSFKGTLASPKIADVFAQTAKRKGFDVEVKGVGIADGGEGTLSAILSCGKYERITAECHNPLFEKITASYALSGDTAIVETAEASGLTLIEYKDGNALHATTYGTGELILDAIKRGAKKIFLCLGGSATNDGGIGALSALGFVFLDKYGKEVKPVGESLDKIADVDLSKTTYLSDKEFVLVSDVDNPLTGEFGATRFFGKQKGAVGSFADALENGMLNYAFVTEKITGVRLEDMKCAGAAGGLSGGFIAYLNAKPRSGIDCLLDLIGYDEKLDGIDAVITGEGRIDEQSLHGKAVFGVCERAKKKGIDVYAIAGYTTLSDEETKNGGIKHVETLLSYAESVDDSIKNAPLYAEKAAEKLLEIISES